LVAGDSHTDGVLKHNSEFFIIIWEEAQHSTVTSISFSSKFVKQPSIGTAIPSVNESPKTTSLFVSTLTFRSASQKPFEFDS
jgi:hypothetical protein